jgi:hypothetical protein
MMMGIPQIIWCVLMAISLLLSANNHNKPKTGVYKFWYTLVAVVIEVTLLILGGFFNIPVNK